MRVKCKDSQVCFNFADTIKVYTGAQVKRLGCVERGLRNLNCGQYGHFEAPYRVSVFTWEIVYNSSSLDQGHNTSSKTTRIPGEHIAESILTKIVTKY